MKISDKLFPKGYPEICVLDIDGNVVKTIKGENLVVTKGRAGLVLTLGGSASAPGAITKCSVGYGGAVVGSTPFTPIPVVLSDVALNNEHPNPGKKAIETTTFDDNSEPTQVTYTTVFTSEEIDNVANANSYVNEAAIWFANDRMYARYTFPTIDLDATYGYSIEIRWIVKFTSA